VTAYARVAPLSPTKAAAIIGKSKMLEQIPTKRVAVKMLDGRIHVSTETCRAFLDSLPDQHVKGQPVKNVEPVISKKLKAKHGRRKTRH
jgi:hypothetical protein